MQIEKEDLEGASREQLLRFARWLKVIPTLEGVMFKPEDLSNDELVEEIDAKMNPPVEQ